MLIQQQPQQRIYCKNYTDQASCQVNAECRWDGMQNMCRYNDPNRQQRQPAFLAGFQGAPGFGAPIPAPTPAPTFAPTPASALPAIVI